MSEKSFLHSGDIERITQMISQLEGQTFGQWLRLTTIGIGIADLCIDMNRGWEKVNGFRFEQTKELEIARRFCDDFNAATTPIRQRLANELRQLLANECLDLGAKALEKHNVIK